jgi:hypothetical protein
MPVSARKTQDVKQKPKKAEFPAGSLEAKLAALGRKVPAREWNRLPAASSINIDSVVYHRPKLP